MINETLIAWWEVTVREINSYITKSERNSKNIKTTQNPLVV
jgi:hypothetical protein